MGADLVGAVGDAQAKMPDARTHSLCLLLFVIACRVVTPAEISVWTVDINSVGVIAPAREFRSLLALCGGSLVAAVSR